MLVIIFLVWPIGLTGAQGLLDNDLTDFPEFPIEDEPLADNQVDSTNPATNQKTETASTTVADSGTGLPTLPMTALAITLSAGVLLTIRWLKRSK